MHSKQQPLFIDMVDNLHLVVALITVEQRIVDNRTIEPGGVIKDVLFSVIVAVIELVSKVVCLVESGIVDVDIFRVVGYLYTGFG